MTSHDFEKDVREDMEKVLANDLGDLGKEEQRMSFVEENKEQIVFDCPVVNGVLAPMPLSRVPMVEPPTSFVDFQQQTSPISSPVQSSRHSRVNLKILEELFFKLFKFPEANEQYILEQHEVKTGATERWRLLREQKNKRWNVGIYDLEQRSHVVFPMEEDPTPPIFLKMRNFSLQERLTGWKFEKRKRPNNGREEMFYYHQKKQFRSFVEVVTFILYASKPKALKPPS